MGEVIWRFAPLCQRVDPSPSPSSASGVPDPTGYGVRT
uniref:Uncharacterized protein n=1 Tax=Nonomuraea gerenzanensis TaxID=93944 RepID=A0A1M4E395_9ACTN|nr:hypothetical protein BN4615_P2829 [Nonomuraea gerenzanensis]